MLQQIRNYDSFHFNGLPFIEAADTSLKRTNKLKAAFRLLGPVFTKYGVFDSWGICLLHKHWYLTEIEIPIQHVSKGEIGQEYVTTPRKTGFSDEFWPSVYCVQNGNAPLLKAMEFTTDLSAFEANRVLDSKPAFIGEFCDILISNDLESTFGLISLKKTSSSEVELVEFNYNDRVSVVRETSATEIQGKPLIETSWQFIPSYDGPTLNQSCTTKCAAFCDVRDQGHTPFHQTYHDPHSEDGPLRPVGNPRKVI